MIRKRRGRVMSVQDFGGENSVLAPKKFARKIVVNNDLEVLAKQMIELDKQIKSLSDRKNTIRFELLERSKPLGVRDDKGNLFARVGRFTIKHELRRTIKPKEYDQVDNDWVESKGLKLNKLFKKEIIYTLDEDYVESLIESEVLTKEEVEEHLLDISHSVALKVVEDKEEEVNA